MSILVPLLAASLLGPLAFASSASQDDPEPTSSWSFPRVDLSPGTTLPNFALPTTKSEKPVFLHNLIAGKKTVLHLFASW